MKNSRNYKNYEAKYISNLLASHSSKFSLTTYFSPTTVVYLKRYSKLILTSIIALFVVFTFTFIMFDSINIDPEIYTNTLQKGDQAAIDQIANELHLNESSWNRYWYAWGDVFSKGMGQSWNNAGLTVSQEILPRMAISLQIGLIATAFSFLIGIPLGVIFGSTKGELIDWTSAILSSIAFSVPVFVIGLIFLVINNSLGISTVWDEYNAFMYLIPALVLSIPVAFTYSRYLKVSINLEWSKQYVSFAKVKGAGKNRILYKHTFKSAMFPIVTFLPFVFISVFIGSITIETIFGIPGAGSLLLESVLNGNQSVLLGLVFFYTLITVVSFFIRDIMYDVLDPRIRVKN